MAKIEKRNKAHISDNKTQSLSIEENTYFDDSILPPSEELIKLKSVKDDGIDWLFRRIEIEQNARIKFNNDRINLEKKDLNQWFSLNLISMLIAFSIIVGGGFFSFYMLKIDMKLEGTLFAGATIVLAASIFLRKNKTKLK
jgi:uncharacterized membrane protein